MRHTEGRGFDERRVGEEEYRKEGRKVGIEGETALKENTPQDGWPHDRAVETLRGATGH